MEYVDLQVRVPLQRAIGRSTFFEGSDGGGYDDEENGTRHVSLLSPQVNLNKWRSC